MTFMARISLCVSLLIAMALPSSAGTWRWSHPHPTGATLRNLTMADRGRFLWAVGETGTIVASADSGETWNIQTTPRRENLNAVCAVSRTGVWAAGDGGLVLVSRDGGKRWEVQPTGVMVNLGAIVMLDAERGWAVGEGGVVLKTTDGGRLWVPQRQEVGAFLTDVAAFGPDRVIAVGWRHGVAHGEAIILTTRDGGATWDEKSLGPTHRLTAICVERGGEQAWVVGAPEGRNTPPLVMESSDAGLTWRLRSITASGALYGIVAHDSTVTAVGVSETGQAWAVRSRDGGRTWDVQEHPIRARLLSVAGPRRERLVAVGEGGAILGPADIGTRFIRRPARSSLRAIAFTNARRGCAVGDDGFIVCTNDSGSHWSVPASLLPAGYRSIIWTSRDVAYAVAEGGIVVRTLDGGQSWEMRPAPTETDLADIAVQRATVWAVGLDGFVMRSEDRGNTWAVVNTPASEPLIGVEVNPEGEAFVLGASGRLWRAVADGSSWTELRTGLRGQATALAVPTGNTIIVAGASGGTEDGPNVLARSTDGGRNWRRVSVSIRVEAMIFTSERVGAVLGGSTILTTSDGGATWERTDVPTDARFHAIDAVDGLVWVAGDFSAIIRVAP